MICCECNGLCILLGTLGTLDHWRCRYCGMEFSSPAGEDEEAVL